MNSAPKYHAYPEEFHDLQFLQPEILKKFLYEIPPHNFKIPEGQNSSQFTDRSGLSIWGAYTHAYIISSILHCIPPLTHPLYVIPSHPIGPARG
ncbi:hypothetical protein F4815DRAFT_466914 [Daldinia loculata]|nr:hypothetical protein F4815DRAFT_466914 [Daldinia loculata]